MEDKIQITKHPPIGGCFLWCPERESPLAPTRGPGRLRTDPLLAGLSPPVRFPNKNRYSFEYLFLWCPERESNPHPVVRSHVFYPLNYQDERGESSAKWRLRQGLDPAKVRAHLWRLHD